MKLRIASVMLFVCIVAALAGYQHSGINLVSPSVLNAREAEFNLGHRFYGTVWEDPLDTFFGMNAGANVQVGYRQNFGHGAEARAAYTRKFNQYEVGASWSFLPADYPLQAQADIAYVSFAIPQMDERRGNFRYTLSAQNKPLWDRLVMTVNAGYEGYYERFISGVGVAVLATESVALIGEYYPTLDRESASDQLSANLGAHDAFALGIKIDTYGHNFIFSVGNADHFEIGRQSLGTNNANKLRFGFNIRRRLYF